MFSFSRDCVKNTLIQLSALTSGSKLFNSESQQSEHFHLQHSLQCIVLVTVIVSTPRMSHLLSVYVRAIACKVLLMTKLDSVMHNMNMQPPCEKAPG